MIGRPKRITLEFSSPMNEFFCVLFGGFAAWREMRFDGVRLVCARPFAPTIDYTLRKCPGGVSQSQAERTVVPPEDGPTVSAAVKLMPYSRLSFDGRHEVPERQHEAWPVDDSGDFAVVHDEPSTDW
jgi:hypothetical protein